PGRGASAGTRPGEPGSLGEAANGSGGRDRPAHAPARLPRRLQGDRMSGQPLSSREPSRPRFGSTSRSSSRPGANPTSGSIWPDPSPGLSSLPARPHFRILDLEPVLRTRTASTDPELTPRDLTI